MDDDAGSGQAPLGQRQAVLETYRSIRLAIVLLVVLLAASVVAQAVAAGCWQTSVSAYYWTAAHSVFVAVLCAIGMCLLVYKGSSPVEDAVLDFSGFLAFVVAMVPTGRERICGGPSLPPEYVAADGVRNNVLAVLVAGAVAQAVALVLVARGHARRAPDGAARWARAIGWLVVAVGAVVFFTEPQRLVTSGHDVAAPTMFVGVILVVWINARQARRARERASYATTYRVIAVAMAVTLVVVGLLRFVVVPAWEHAVIVVEALLVAEFAAFWLVQTAELWHVVDRRELMPDAHRAALAERG